VLHYGGDVDIHEQNWKYLCAHGGNVCYGWSPSVYREIGLGSSAIRSYRERIRQGLLFKELQPILGPCFTADHRINTDIYNKLGLRLLSLPLWGARTSAETIVNGVMLHWKLRVVSSFDEPDLKMLFDVYFRRGSQNRSIHVMRITRFSFLRGREHLAGCTGRRGTLA
jgi:hypothetical protein